MNDIKKLREYIRRQINLILEEDTTQTTQTNQPFKKTVYGYQKKDFTKTFTNQIQYMNWKKSNERAKDPLKVYITDKDGNSD